VIKISLWGLDVIVNNEKYIINEFNGVDSGMKGFEFIYGDKRVQNKVYEMLKEKYGYITINDGTYSKNKLKKENFLLYLWKSVKEKVPNKIKTLNSFTKMVFLSRVLSSKKAEVDWINDKIKKFSGSILSCFDIYTGQESTIFNKVNEVLDKKSINDYTAEELAKNKFLQYFTMKNTELKENFPESVLVGLGATDEKGLDNLLKKYDRFVIKPIIGSCGKGVRILNKNEAEKYKNTSGPIDNISDFKIFMERIGVMRIKYFQDLIEEGDFSFEKGLSLIQPFINSEVSINGEKFYSVVRAIICNGEFVDAYLRVSHNPTVNLSQDAKAVPFNYNGFSEFCENAVHIFEKESQKYDPYTMKKFLYNKYIKETRLKRK